MVDMLEGSELARVETPEGHAAAEHEGGMPFFPDFALREALTALAYLVALVVLAAVTTPELDEIGDPNATGFKPRPEWYFLWLFEMLKYFPGELEVVGTVVIPGLLLTALVAVPFIDRRGAPVVRRLMPGTRPVRVWPRLVGVGALVVIGALTAKGLEASTPMQEPGPKLTAVQATGRAFYERMGCPTCHTIGGEGGDRGPELTTFGAEPDAAQRVLLHFAGLSPQRESQMPVYQLDPNELRALSEYLLSRK
jgi:mono/diheme cytochrome c family protein